MFSDPTPEHQWLKQLEGDWTFEHDCTLGADGQTSRSTGKETVRMLGDLWAVGEMTGEVPGEDGSPTHMTAILSVGYDPDKDAFIGSWCCSVMAGMFVYENGSLDADRKVLTLNTTGPSFTDPTKRAAYQDIIEIKDENTRMLRSRFKDDDGNWNQFMSGVYRRVN